MAQDKAFSFQPFSDQQMRLMYWWSEGSPYRDCDMVIADGSIRSGKTVAMICGFMIWSMETFRGETFILAGKTIGALKRNVIAPLRQILDAWALRYHYVSSGDEARIEVGGNKYYLYDAHNERSQDRLQGLTAAGALADEVALFPRNFVEQMIGRCSVAGARIWLNCNPENPAHYVKTELIDQAEGKHIYHLHFTMQDNLALSRRTKEMFARMYTGVFYRRFILGEWALTEGLVYQLFADDPGRFTVQELPQIRQAFIGVDFGGTGSAHSFTLSGITPSYDVIVLDEYYHNNQTGGVLSPAQVEAAFVDFCRRAKERFRVYEAYCDSAEQTMIQGLRIAVMRAHLAIEVKNAVKGPINDRIAFFNSMLAQNRFRIFAGCQATVKALREAIYDPKKPTEDVRLDNGTTNIDSLDSLEYSIEPRMNDLLYLGMRR